MYLVSQRWANVGPAMPALDQHREALYQRSGALGRRCGSATTRTDAIIPRYSIDSEHVLPADICGTRARLEGQEQGLQRIVGSYRSAH